MGFLSPQVVLKPSVAMGKAKRAVLLKDCEGELSGEFAYVYPPGIPILVPGERITAEVVEVLRGNRQNGFEVLGTENFAGGEILVVEEERSQ